MDAAQGLRYLHAKNVLHLDVKSANLLLEREVYAPPSFGGHIDSRGKPRIALKAKVADFGISSMLSDEGRHLSLEGKQFIGTVSFTAPEQFALPPELQARPPSPVSEVGAAEGGGPGTPPPLDLDPLTALSSQVRFSSFSSGRGDASSGPAGSATPAAGSAPNTAKLKGAGEGRHGHGHRGGHRRHHRPTDKASPGPGRTITRAADCYSFGMVLWELWTRKAPWMHLEDPNPLAIMVNVIRGCRPPTPGTRAWAVAYPGSAGGEGPEEPAAGWKIMMEACWTKNPDDRPSFDVLCTRLEGMLAACELALKLEAA